MSVDALAGWLSSEDFFELRSPLKTKELWDRHWKSRRELALGALRCLKLSPLNLIDLDELPEECAVSITNGKRLISVPY